MIAGLKPYPVMKNSGVAWLGEVPGHWDVLPLRRATISRCDGPFGSALKSSHYADQGVRVVRLQNIGHAEFRDKDAAFIHPSYYASLGDHTVESGDLLIAGLGDEHHPAGRACVAPPFVVPAMVKADCFRFRLLRQRLEPHFAALQLTATAVDASSFLSTGATRQRTNLQATASRSIAIPPTQEQSTIVRFLNHADQRIRRYIRAKQKLIKLLEEQKQATIHRAVTRGLDPNVRLKPSGVEWLGDVPEHWEVRPAKYFYRETDERSETGGEELLSVSHITGVTPRSQKNITMFMAESYVGHKVCKPGDLVINTMWAWMAALGVSRQDGIVSPSYGVYRPTRLGSLLGEYADLLLRTSPDNSRM